MKTLRKTSFFALTLLLFIFTACSKDDDNPTPPEEEIVLSDAKQITGLTFNASNNAALDQNVTASINETDKTISATVPYGTNVSNLNATVQVSAKASVTPNGGQNFSSPVTYTVTAEDGSEANYQASVEITPNDAKQITSFVFLASANTTLNEDVFATINETAKIITATVPYGTDITALIPEVEISTDASISPSEAQDFSSLVNYVVTAQDGTTASYSAEVNITPNDESQMLSFNFLASLNNNIDEDVIAVIDEETKTIRLEIPITADITKLLPSVEISPDASVNPEDEQDFTNEVVYTVTAQDGSETEYTVEVFYSEHEILEAFYNANPGNTLNWDLNDTDIQNWPGVTTVNGRVVQLQMDSKNLTVFSSEIQYLKELTTLVLFSNQLTEIPVEIGKLTNLTGLYLSNNNLSKIPVEVGQLSNLSALRLHNNNIEEIPTALGELINLNDLWLQNNNISEVPEELGQLINLTQLRLEDNNITSIPQAVCDLATLYGTNISMDAGVTCE